MQYNCEAITAYDLVKSQLRSQRPTLEQLSSSIFPCGGPKPQSVIEITGDTGAGKTLLLGQIAAYSLVPQQFGGRSVNALVLDNEHQFSLKRLAFFMEHIVQTANNVNNIITATQCNEQNELLDKCFNGLKLFSCHSSLQYELAMHDVEDLLLTNSNIALLAVDALDTFYWEDNYHERQTKSAYLESKISKLRQICNDYNINVIYTLDTKAKKDLPRKPDYSLHMRKLEGEGKFKLNDRDICINKHDIDIGQMRAEGVLQIDLVLQVGHWDIDFNGVIEELKKIPSTKFNQNKRYIST